MVVSLSMPKPTSPGADAETLIQERQRAEDALRASEERLRHIVEHAQDLIYYCDPGGRFTYVNPAAARVMKYAEHELIGRHFLTLIRPD
jgi:PAS domain-containing protein